MLSVFLVKNTTCITVLFGYADSYKKNVNFKIHSFTIIIGRSTLKRGQFTKDTLICWARARIRPTFVVYKRKIGNIILTFFPTNIVKRYDPQNKYKLID